IAEAASPRFHCSRCDHLFSIDTSEAAPRPRPVEAQTAPFRISDSSDQPATPSVAARTQTDEPPSWSLGLPRAERAPAKPFEPPAATHSILHSISDRDEPAHSSATEGLGYS